MGFYRAGSDFRRASVQTRENRGAEVHLKGARALDLDELLLEALYNVAGRACPLLRRELVDLLGILSQGMQN